ncbi:alpha/beta hydrolase [Cupriavidus sp. BIC8F]|uniref:alpha/beta fold hydrolase n=1 Tax=Cupriavidus sp. BIC8F TaxID=3079014 RepID=UPI0029161152|nr:alpha/beta hydrolase [Cupriavidus sp. BIC8F]
MTLHVLAFGEHTTGAPPLLCLHGVTGNAWLWHDVADHLSQGGLVLAPDLRGHGDSRWSAKAEYSTSDHVRDLAGILDALEIEVCDIAGLSWGGLIALEYTANYPGRVRRLAVLDVEPSYQQADDAVPPRPTQFPDRNSVYTWERAANLNAPDPLLHLFAASSVRPGDDGTWARKHDRFFFTRWPFRNDDAWATLEQLRLPTLFLHGERSFVRRQVMEEMAARVHGAVFHSLKDTGHLLPLEAPQSVSEHLEAFLRS